MMNAGRIFGGGGISRVKSSCDTVRHFSRGVDLFSSKYTALFPSVNDAADVPYRELEHLRSAIRVIDTSHGEFLHVAPEALRELAGEAMNDIAHLLRPGHLQQLADILDDPEASTNDRFVALELLKNANVASGMVLPGCQDTGTAIAIGKRGGRILTDGNDESHISQGVFNTYTQQNLRYSQVAPEDMFIEHNTRCNLPAQIELYAAPGDEYHFLFMAKGGGSANKTFLYQETKALLNERSLEAFLGDKIKTLGTAACPPYHLAVVIGGLSAELTLKAVKLASAKYLDGLPTAAETGTGDRPLGHAFRDLEWEARVHRMTQAMGIGAQFGGKYFCHDVRVVRLPRHGASCPVGIGVSCSADRQCKAKITRDGVFIEELARDVGVYLPEVTDENLGRGSKEATNTVALSLDQPMDKIRNMLSKYPIRTRLSLTGTLVVARDIAHAKLLDRIENGEGLPGYAKDHIIYYAGPAKTPQGYASGSFGPTTAGRMDSYIDRFMSEGGSLVTLAKGNRSRQVTRACQKYGGFYLGSIGGPAAILAQNSIKKVEILDNAEDGMEAVWRIEVENFPAFIVTDDKGNARPMVTLSHKKF